jgi:hypothetical protein
VYSIIMIRSNHNYTIHTKLSKINCYISTNFSSELSVHA